MGVPVVGVSGVDDAVGAGHQRDAERVDRAHCCDRRVAGEVDGVAGGSAQRRGRRPSISPSGAVCTRSALAKLVQRIVEVDAKGSSGRAQVVAMDLSTVTEAAQHGSVEFADRGRQLLGGGGDRLGGAPGLVGHQITPMNVTMVWTRLLR